MRVLGDKRAQRFKAAALSSLCAYIQSLEPIFKHGAVTIVRQFYCAWKRALARSSASAATGERQRQVLSLLALLVQTVERQFCSPWAKRASAVAAAAACTQFTRFTSTNPLSLAALLVQECRY
jgi:hypothetical protein